MAEFKSWREYAEFASFIMQKSRYILDDRSRAFLDTVVRTAEKRKKSLVKGAALWRAQLGHRWESVDYPMIGRVGPSDVKSPYLPERMIPLRDRANEGRVNPKGIPCLYLSTDRDTAMNETRPWIGSCVSVAQFVVLRDMTVVDCSEDPKETGIPSFEHRRTTSEAESEWVLIEPEAEEWDEVVWAEINRALSQPVTRQDDLAEYAPTQIIAEAFRNAGYDGIAYGSKLGEGQTVALFDLDVAALISCHLYRVSAINLTYEFAGEPYYTRLPISGSGMDKT